MVDHALAGIDEIEVDGVLAFKAKCTCGKELNGLVKYNVISRIKKHIRYPTMEV